MLSQNQNLRTHSSTYHLTRNKKHLPHLVTQAEIDWDFLSNLNFEDDTYYHNITNKRRLHHPIGKLLTEKQVGFSELVIYRPEWSHIEIDPKVANIINCVCSDWDIAAVYKYNENDIEVSHRVSYPYPSTRHIVSNVDVNLTTCLKNYYVKSNNVIKVLGDARHSINSFGVPRITLCVWNSMEK